MRRALVGLTVAVSYTLLVGVLLLLVLALTTAIADGWKVRAAGAAVTERSPAFSPDGRHIAFLRTQGTTARLWVMGADGSDQQPLAQASRFSWTPDGAALLFTRGGRKVFRVSVDGGLPVASAAQLGPTTTRWGGATVFVRDHHVSIRNDKGVVWSLT
jgi:Tol biopolymer transport system component